ncbi:3-phosphoshikimate 1-carboxyvinyltransferase [Apilactobacillus timberlakei]|uniref:3-phosphoshikimate 1-carboxyvinyltransferase n=1 Tax=Apilactobacillus timberlakei TaxID=2008380 RepID=A0ABY2YTJ8_9LACO|nr:3-phosphoshikimate 1-carboxyvinyltransferase [Apilactobacillus timberlakei]TPR14310.1 3-phosphoshikimate 1-carboxyvinyltransferase [Apilactobacillus timberlakei]TPR16563.1 3-phosphoshikimate 1-carboxyvinyltransferase [Apilactobacillus timberlakei]TPR19249.1 3-phosphoshikimate 1-carboxyvinyltransferase [Apilactobacillus timberlakei]
MKQLIGNQNKRLNGSLSVPGDKSISHRSIMIAAISEGKSIIHNFLFSDDCLTTIKTFQQMGIAINNLDNKIIVHGKGLHGLKAPKNSLNMGNSGTTTRLLSGILAAQSFTSELFGDNSLSKRPMQRISIPLSQMGAQIDTCNGHLPMTIKGNKISAIDYDLPIASAQVKSAIILAALYANGDTIIHGQQTTRDHTERMLNQFGKRKVVERNENQVIVHADSQLKGQTFIIPGDISSAAFFMVAATIVPNSHIILKSVGVNPTRIGIIKVLKAMNADITFHNFQDNEEPIADIEVKSVKHLKPIHIGKSDIPSMIDELPLIALLAAKSDGISTIHGAEELHFKETDRIETVANEFQKLGISIKALSDGFLIDGQSQWHLVDKNLNSHDDHRIGMTLAVASLMFKETINLAHADAIKISYPTFFKDLEQLLRS